MDSTPQPSFGQRLAELTVLWVMAVAQPLFDLLSRHAEFLVAHRLQAADLILLAFGLAVIPPALVGAAESLAGRLHRPAAGWLHLAALAVLAAAGILRICRLLGLAPWVFAAGAAAGGAAVAWLSRRHPMRIFLRFLAPAVLLLPLWFLVSSPVRSLLLASAKERLSLRRVAAAPTSATPILVVVFDELPLASLLDGGEQIDRRRYPSFAALAAEATWYRRATTVIHTTSESLPAILTGRYPLADKLPILPHHPENLCSWLRASHRLEAFEPMTDLCPRTATAAGEDRSERLASTVSDLWIVYQHLVSPPSLGARLAPISTTWRDFAAGHRRPGAGGRRYWGDLPATVDQFVARLRPSSPPGFYYLHLLLPHLQWKYLPSGEEYGPLGATLFPWGLEGERWSDDRWATLQGLQRHLLQLAYTDKVLGTLIEGMKARGLWSRALVIVTADHGASFWPRGPRRGISERNVWEILRVPLLIKYPHQREGEIVDRAVELVDIMPTVADVLGFELPWAVDGRSLAAGSSPPRPSHTLVVEEQGGRRRRQLVFDPDGLRPAVERKIRWFGSGAADLFALGPSAELLGRRAADLVTDAAARSEVRLEDRRSFESVDPDSGYLPARIVGEIHRRGAAGVRPAGVRPSGELAISVNGHIRATTHTRETAAGGWRFMAMVPADSLRPGANQIEVFEIVAAASGARLRPTRRAAAPDFRLLRGDGRDLIERSDGRRYRSGAGVLRGRVFCDSTQFWGWAVDGAGEPVESVLLFHDRELITRATLGSVAGGQAEALAKLGIPAADGFSFLIPYAVIGTPDPARLSFWALAGETATPLAYEERFKH